MKPEQKQRKTKDRHDGSQLEQLSQQLGQDPFSLFSGLQNPIWDFWPVADLYVEPVAADNLENAKIPVYCERDVLAWCIAVLSTSPTARLMIKEAMNLGWQMGLADLKGHDFHLDVPEKIIMIDNNGLLPEALGNSEYFRNIILISMVRALRDAWHEKRHGGFEKYDAEAILMLERARAADCDVMSVLCAWELRSDGHSKLWRHLIGTDEGDMALAFSNYLEKDPSSLFTGKALAATFRQWYQGVERINASDHETLEYLDTLILSSNGENPFGKTELTPVGIELISCLPDKSAYLQRQGREILSDPLYAGLSDPINQSHFMHMMYDLQVTYVQGVPFRDTGLAEKIFPNGLFTPENDRVTRES